MASFKMCNHRVSSFVRGSILAVAALFMTFITVGCSNTRQAYGDERLSILGAISQYESTRGHRLCQLMEAQIKVDDAKQAAEAGYYTRDTDPMGNQQSTWRRASLVQSERGWVVDQPVIAKMLGG
jgi:hypothetical protein